MNFGHVAVSLFRSCEFLSSEPGAVCGSAFLTLSFPQMRCPILIVAPWLPMPSLIASSHFTALS